MAVWFQSPTTALAHSLLGRGERVKTTILEPAGEESHDPVAVLDPLRAHLTAKTETWLVRSSPARCAVHGYHTAKTVLAPVYVDVSDEATWASARVPYLDSSWPTTCDCGYSFAYDDSQVRLCLPLLRLTDGREVNYRDAPAGTWWEDMESQ
jgi:hypothetical protein